MRGCAGKTSGPSTRPQPLDDAAEPLVLRHVRLAVHGRDGVAAGLERRAASSTSERSRASGAKSRDASAITSPTTSIRPPTPSLVELPRRALVGAEQQRRHAVDRDPVPLLRHRQVEAPQPGLDVRDGHARRRPRAPASVEFVSPKTSTQSGRSAATASRTPGRIASGVGARAVEPVARLAEPELVEEDLRQLRVVVLAGVQHDLVDPGLPQRRRERRRLDELRAGSRRPRGRASVATLRALSRAVSSVGRAGDS